MAKTKGRPPVACLPGARGRKWRTVQLPRWASCSREEDGHGQTASGRDRVRRGLKPVRSAQWRAAVVAVGSIAILAVVVWIAGGAWLPPREVRRREQDPNPSHLTIRLVARAGAQVPPIGGNETSSQLLRPRPSPGGLSAGAEVDALPGGNALMRAARLSADPKTLAILVDAGADPNTRTRDGGTALHMAAFYRTDAQWISAFA